MRKTTWDKSKIHIFSSLGFLETSFHFSSSRPFFLTKKKKYVSPTCIVLKLIRLENFFTECMRRNDQWKDFIVKVDLCRVRSSDYSVCSARLWERRGGV